MEKEAKVFKYQTPVFDGVKKTILMCCSDLMRVHAQVVKSGGENNLPRQHRGVEALDGGVESIPALMAKGITQGTRLG